MFERDYIMRLMQTFFEDVAKIVHRKRDPDDEYQLEAFGELYKEYLKNDRKHYYQLSAESLINSFREDADGIYKAEMLATLLYQDARLQKDEMIRKELLEKSLALYQFMDTESKDFSLERKEMIETIKDLLH